MDTGERSGASFRDPSGFIFRRNGSIYRQVNKGYSSSFAKLKASGLYAELTAAGLLIPHEDVDLTPPLPAIAERVIRPEPIPFISYPYEWCFGQLKDAALATLEIQLSALRHGMTLKDASAFNIQFMDGRPILIDSLSFEPYEEGRPWVAYRQFCEHFVAPLLLVSQVDPSLSRLPQLTVDGIPLKTASRLLSWWSWLQPSTLLNVHLHARSIEKYGRKAVPHRIEARGLSKRGMVNLVEGLRHAIRKISWSPVDTEWSDYETEHAYTGDQMDEKCRVVSEFLAEVKPGVVWDLGANTGTFSRIAMHEGAFVVSADLDPAAVERNYLRMKACGETGLHPLWIDLRNPTPPLGWAGEERESLAERSNANLVLALALVHHLAIGANVPLRLITQWLSRLAQELIVEFVPKEDPQAQRLLLSRKDIFDRYERANFEAALEEFFSIRRIHHLDASRRVLYRCRRRPDDGN